MLLLNKIKLKNFLSHADTEVSFLPEQKLLIDGKSGCGKSGVVEAITWVLYNQSRTGNNRALIKRGAKNVAVTLILDEATDDGTKSYKIERSLTSNGKHTFDVLEEKDGKWLPIQSEGLRNIQSYLEEKILHSSYLLFVNSISYPQENSDNFVKQTATKRKDLILEIVKASAYDEYYEKAKKLLGAKETELVKITSGMDEKKNTIAIDEAQASQLETEIKREVELREDLDKVQKTLDEIETKEKQNIEIRTKVTEKTNLKDKIFTELALLEIEIENDKKVVSEAVDLTKLKEKVSNLASLRLQRTTLNENEIKFTKWNEEMVKIMSEKPAEINYEIQIANLNNQIIGIMKEPDEICSEIGRICPKIATRKAIEVSNLTERLNKAQEGCRTQNDALSGHSTRIKALGSMPVSIREELLDVSRQITELEGIEKQYLEAVNANRLSDEIKKNIVSEEKKIQGMKDNIATLETEIRDLSILIDPTLEVSKNTQVIKKESLTKMFLQNQQLLAVINEAVGRVKKNQEDVTKMETDLKVIKEEIETLEIIKKAFGANGIKNIVVDMVIPVLEDRINVVLKKLSNFRIELKTQKATTDGESVIEGLFINIINDQGEEFELSNYSGGEKTKIITAIAEGLAEIQNFGFRIFDESIIGLDTETIESFVAVLASIKERSKQLVCISHIADVKEIFDDKILITKIRGTSFVN